MLVPIESHSHLSRDIHSMGVVATNKNTWQAAQTRKLVEVRKNTEITNLKDKVNELDAKMNLILDKLTAVLG
jgi:hypothetical protein